MNRTPDEMQLDALIREPRQPNSRPAFTIILPTSPQIPTPSREFLLETPIEGVSSIATVAKLAGWDVKIRDLRIGEDFEDACSDAAKRGGVVAMPTFIDAFPVTRRVLARVRELNPNVPIVIGGALVSSLPEPLINGLGADYAVLREGEATLLDLLSHIEKGGTPESARGIYGLGIRTNGSIYFTPERQQINDLDVLPIPDLFLYPSVQKDPVVPELGLTTARGCYGRCTFCFLNMRKLTYKSPARFEKEVADLVTKHKIKYFFVNDLTFTSKIDRSYQICDILKNHGLTWSCSTRVERVKPVLLQYMKKSGCREIWYGVESLEQDVLNLSNKMTKVDEIEHAVRETEKAGIQVMANLMVGLPGESVESLRKMMDFCKRTDVIPSSIKYLTPFPGTKIYDMAVERGFIKDPLAYLEELAGRKVNDVNDAFINLTDMPEQRLREAYEQLLQIRSERMQAASL
jgi:anaerobic magnesium-protoporphyrin IX monomethyl ester cyclase